MSQDPKPPVPEQTFFADPCLDRMMGVIFRLAAELHVTRDRIHALERVLESRGQLRPGELDNLNPDPARAEELGRQNADYVKSILSPLLGEQASKSLGVDHVKA